MGLRKTLERLILGRRRADARRAGRITRSPDRGVLTETYFPAFAARGGRMLWVGCRLYTAGYPALLEAAGGEVWTTDIEPRAEAWGRAGRHRTGDVRTADVLFADLGFDAVLCNGVLGFGVDRPEDQLRALTALARILGPGGLMLLGWNTDRIGDPLALAEAAGLTPTAEGALPPRRAVPGTTHVYDLFRKG